MKRYVAYAACALLFTGCASEQEQERLVQIERRYHALEQKVDRLEEQLKKSSEGIATVQSTINSQHEYFRDEK